jgi:hypothetical protein
MKGRASAVTLGLAGGLALGVWIGSEMTSGREAAAPGPAVVAEQTAEEPAVVPQPAKPRRANSLARARAAAAVEAPAPESAPRLVKTIPASAPELHDRIKPVLARGTKVSLAAEGFTDAEQFATLAHAARNTNVPFILLKHRVLAEGQSLEDAIRASNPDVDARVEALRAKGEARAHILSLTLPAQGNNASSN